MTDIDHLLDINNINTDDVDLLRIAYLDTLNFIKLIKFNQSNLVPLLEENISGYSQLELSHYRNRVNDLTALISKQMQMLTIIGIGEILPVYTG